MKESSFVKVLQKRLRVNVIDMGKMMLDDQWIKRRCIPMFYKEMLRWFKALEISKEPNTGQKVREQPMWHNGFITVQGKTLSSNENIEKRIALVDDFLGGDGRVLSYHAFMEQNRGLSVNPLTYMGWCRAIPPTWKRLAVGTDRLSASEKEKIPTLSVKGKDVIITLIKPSFFNGLLVKQVKPTAQLRWETDGVDFGDEWNKVYARAFNVTKSTKLQSLQFKIIHRIFPTRRFLCVRNITDDPFCDNCGEIESIEHYFFACEQVQIFWRKLVVELNNKLSIREQIELDCDKVLFGTAMYSKVINFIILLAKQFIVTQHYQDSIIQYEQFLPVVIRNFEIEKLIARSDVEKEKFCNRWTPFITNRGDIDMCNISDHMM